MNPSVNKGKLHSSHIRLSSACVSECLLACSSVQECGGHREEELGCLPSHPGGWGPVCLCQRSKLPATLLHVHHQLHTGAATGRESSGDARTKSSCELGRSTLIFSELEVWFLVEPDMQQNRFEDDPCGGLRSCIHPGFVKHFGWEGGKKRPNSYVMLIKLLPFLSFSITQPHTYATHSLPLSVKCEHSRMSQH